MVQRPLTLALAVVLLVGFVGRDPQSLANQAQAPAEITAPTAVQLDLSMLDVSDARASAGATPLASEPFAEPPVASEVAAADAQPEPAPAPVLPPAKPAPAAAAPRIVPVAQVEPVAPPAPATCPTNFFCYPRVGISGPIVPYGDCEATTDVGTAIRSLTCVSPTYLAAHAYTQFGRITGWRAGDIVFAFGARYVLFDGFTQNACDFPERAPAPLSLQTSLSAVPCGRVLVVQGRPG